MTLDEHIFAVVQAAADAGRAAPRAARDAPPRPRQARARRRARPCGDRRARSPRGSAPPAALSDRRFASRSCEIVRFHPFLLGDGDALEARRLLARHGDELTFDLLDHWDADLRGRDLTEPDARSSSASRVPAPSSSRSSGARTGSPTSPSTAPT